MISSRQNEFDRNSHAVDAEKTLRLIATLPAPDGIEERVKAGLRAAPARSAVILWPFGNVDGRAWWDSSGMRAAAAAAIVLVVVGGGWGVYSHIQLPQSPTAVVAPQQPSAGNGGFAAAGAKRTPQTLDRPVIANPVTIKQKQDADAAKAAPAKHARRASKTAKDATVPAVR